MDNDTKKILLMIARALQVNALAQLTQLAHIRDSELQDALVEDLVSARDLLAKINEAEKNNV